MRITYIAPLSLAKVTFVIYAILGLIFGVFVAAFSALGAVAGAGAGDESALFGAIFGVGAVVVLPILYGGMGAVMSLFMAWLYNLIAGFIGGIEVRTENLPAA